jgi:hypothetical protein
MLHAGMIQYDRGCTTHLRVPVLYRIVRMARMAAHFSTAEVLLW